MNPNTEIGICTMGFNPLMKMHAICNALHQDYCPKVLHLLHQAPFPAKLEHDSYINIIEHNVAGAWPSVWFYKLLTFATKCTSPYFAIMDEDDRFEFCYLTKAIQPILKSAQFAWNLNNITIKNDVSGKKITPVFKMRYYRSGIGTLVGRTEALRHMVLKLAKQCPNGLNEKGHGPIDAVLRSQLQKSGLVVEHTGIRCYFYHMNTNTKGDRDKRECIDFGWTERRIGGHFHKK